VALASKGLELPAVNERIRLGPKWTWRPANLQELSFL
jgi:hypothetical protein